MKKRNIQVCMTPKLFSLYADKKSIVVVVDVLRATSSMCIAFEKGVKRMIPVSTVEEALEYRNSDEDYILAAERNGKPVKSFDFGNSPQVYLDMDVKGRTVVMTTTNGTKAINIAKKDHEVIVGSFLNLDAITQWLKEKDRDVIIFCAGWKDKFNLEDTLFAGALVSSLLETDLYNDSCDAAQAAKFLWDRSKDDLYGFLENSSHRNRLAKLNIDSDIHFCLKINQTKKIPVLKGDFLVIDDV
ncbi:2-phosphosulfolactate phosphatase [Flavobacteriales bacterium]|jgi:2-phosphosulfolactate phosphatase|nr:2-phosphosulfolactate phosphatase [Flavobacteriales bacterium]